MNIKSRKKEHVDLVLKKDVNYSISAGFEDIRFIHCSLPELNMDEIDCSTSLFGKELSCPIIISGMTGGYPQAEKINLKLAKAAENQKVAIGLGSQRAMLEQPSLSKTYKIRKVAKSVPIIGNIGACQLKNYSVEKVRNSLEEIEADGLAIHLNPLQEVIQPEGDSHFRGILNQIEMYVKDLGFPVIVKETGAGISKQIALLLKKIGVQLIDISGAGGTSWSKVEYIRSNEKRTFEDWGNPTCESIASCSQVIEVIASGGIRSGLDCAKAIALGASFAAAAAPFIKAAEPEKELIRWKKELKIAMLLSGSQNIKELKNANLIITGKTAESLLRLGIDPSFYAVRKK